MSKDIQDPTLAQLLTAALGLQGRVRLSLEEFVIPTIQVADLQMGMPPPVARAATAVGLAAAVSGQTATFRFEIPGSLLARIEYLTVRAGAIGTIAASWTATGGPQAGTAEKAFTDGRLLQQAEAPAGVLTFGAQVAGIPPVSWRARIRADTPERFKFDHWVVGSGIPTQFGFLEFAFSAANLAVDLTLEWTEYPFF